jgi:hypothetical protein
MEIAKASVSDDMSVNPEWHTAHLHRQEFSISHGPSGSAIHPLHFKETVGENTDAESLDKVLPDNDNLRAGVIQLLLMISSDSSLIAVVCVDL